MVSAAATRFVPTLTLPETLAREQIDRALTDAGWVVQSIAALNLTAGRGVAVREFPLASGYGVADYLLYVDKEAVGIIEAKKAGVTLSGVELRRTFGAYAARGRADFVIFTRRAVQH